MVKEQVEISGLAVRSELEAVGCRPRPNSTGSPRPLESCCGFAIVVKQNGVSVSRWWSFAAQ